MTRGIKYKLSISGILLALLALALVYALSNASPAARAATGGTTPTTAPATTRAGPNPAGMPGIPAVGGATVISGAGQVQFATAPGPVSAIAFPAGDGSELQGDITKIDGNKITINGGPIINLNDQTVVGDSKGALKASDLQVGDRIFATGTPESDKSLTARWVLKLAALPMIQVGEVSSVDTANNSFKFKAGPDNTEWTAKLSSDTKFNRDSQEIKLSDIAAGDQVMVIGKADATAHTIEATQVQSGFPKPGIIATSNVVAGKVKSVDAANNTFTLDSGLKVTVDSNTKFDGKDLKSLADLKVGDAVMAAGDRQDDGSIKAKNVGPMPEGGPIALPALPVNAGPGMTTGGSFTIVNGIGPELGTNEAVEVAPPTAKAEH